MRCPMSLNDDREGEGRVWGGNVKRSLTAVTVTLCHRLGDNALLASITTEGTKRTLEEVIEEHRSEQEYKASIFACSCADPENDTYAYISDDVEYSREKCGSEWVYS